MSEISIVLNMFTGRWKMVDILVHSEVSLRQYYEKCSWNKGKSTKSKVYTSDGETRVNLVDTASPGRPLVLNFGSFPWSLFITRLTEFKCVVTEFADLEASAKFFFMFIHLGGGGGNWLK